MDLLGRTERLLLTLGFSSAVSASLFILRAIGTQSDRYWFLLWNLFLAWLPLLFAWWLVWQQQKRGWLDWRVIVLLLLWLSFLPNSFYLISDMIHLQTTETNVMYDIAMLTSFAVSGLLLGYTSVYLIHLRLLVRLKAKHAHALIGLVLLAGSFAIYLGRDLRWNTWDILANPAGLLFDISDRFINPANHPQTFSTTVVFFVLLSSIYIIVWQFIKVVRAEPED